MEAHLNQLSADAATPDDRKPLLPKLSAILRGDDLSALAGAADDPALFYTDAVELTLLLEALSVRDWKTVQGVVLVIAASYVLVNLLVDLLYAAIDPRIRVR